MFKKILTASVTAFSLFVIGCGTTDPESASAPTITGPTAPTTLVAGSPVNVVIEISAEDSIIYTGTIKNSAGTAVDATVIGSAVVLNTNKPKEKKITYTLTASATAPAGTYTLEIYATLSNGANATSKFNLVIAGAAGTPVVTATFMAGANKNSTYGSAIDLDAGVAYKMSTIGTNVPNIDLCYAHTTTNGDKLGTPEWAIASGYDFAASWTNSVKTMKFYKTALTVAEFDAITTKEAIPAFDDTKATAISAEAVKGDVFIVKTTEAAVCLLKIDDQVAGEAGTITIKTAK